MSRLKLFVLGIAIFSMNIASSQALIEQEEKPHIDVVGTAVKEIVPDEIYLSIIIKERYEGKEKIDVESQEIQLKNSLKEMGSILIIFICLMSMLIWLGLSGGQKICESERLYTESRWGYCSW